jgi:hypothetical protein
LEAGVFGSAFQAEAMVSLNDSVDVFEVASSDEKLQAVLDLIEGRNVSLSDASTSDVRGSLLLAIANCDDAQFNKIAGQVSARSISASADWCHDDFLVFLLLLGNQKFGRKFDFIGKVLEVRRNNTNAIPQRINEAFSALYREDFAISGEFAFVKVPFISLIGQLNINSSEARYVFKSLREPNLFRQLSPFFKVLAVKAYDYVLLDRTNFEFESSSQLISLVSRESKNLSLKNLFHLVLNLPLKFIVPCLITVLTLTVLIYAGIRFGVEQYDNFRRNSPPHIDIEKAEFQLDDISIVGKSVFEVISNGQHSKNNLLSFKSEPINSARNDFVIEVANIQSEIKDVIVFVQYKSYGARPLIVVPLQINKNSFRAFVPEIKPNAQLVFVILFDKLSSEKIESIRKNLVLRVEG